MAPVGEDIQVPNVLEGGTITIPKELRPYLVEMEVINSHDQHVLENSNPVQNLWSFYQHATVLKIMSEGAKESIIEYQKRSVGASVADVLKWHEGRFQQSGTEMLDLWKQHIVPCTWRKICLCRRKVDGDGGYEWRWKH